MFVGQRNLEEAYDLDWVCDFNKLAHPKKHGSRLCAFDPDVKNIRSLLLERLLVRLQDAHAPDFPPSSLEPFVFLYLH